MLIDVYATVNRKDLSIPYEAEIDLDIDFDCGYRIIGKAKTVDCCSYAGDNEFIVNGRLTFAILGACALCDVSAKAEVTTEYSERFAAANNEDAYPIAGDKLNLAPMLKDAAILALPMRILCKDDCMGLCSKCGQDMNIGCCECDNDDDNPFAVLKTLENREV